MTDLKLIETGNGGDLEKSGNDLAMVDGLQTMVYLSLFGGNVEGDWWGNSLLMAEQPSQQFTSETERALLTVALTSAGRIAIEQAVSNDLKYLKEVYKGLTITVSVVIVNVDRVDISIKLNGAEMVWTWNAGSVVPGYVSPEFFSDEFFNLLLSEDGDYFIPE